MKKELYIVTMYRYGDRQKHSYVLGVWDKKAQATKHGKIEELWRGDKYKHEVVPVQLNIDVTSPEEEMRIKERHWKEGR